ncbi:MAG: cytochrome c [Verrucomicrobiota bacterium]
MSASIETRAVGLASAAGLLALGAALLAATPIRWGSASIVFSSPAAADTPAEQEAPAPPAADAPAEIARGHEYFAMSCVECHGDDAHGDEGPDLHRLAISNARIAATIKHGVKGEMPTFARKYDDTQIAALIAYLRSLD